jgi:hypothetical protein
MAFMLNPGAGKATQRRLNSHKFITEGLDSAALERGNKLSRLFANNTNWLSWPAGTNARGQKVFFCYTTKRNVAGYFLGWREVRPKGSKNSRSSIDYIRTDWCARKVREELKWQQYNRAQAFIAKHQ